MYLLQLCYNAKCYTNATDTFLYDISQNTFYFDAFDDWRLYSLVSPDIAIMFKSVGGRLMYSPLFHIKLSIDNFKHYLKVKYDEIDNSSFGGYCKKQRIDKHLLIKDVADYIGVSSDTYMRIELNRAELLDMDKLKKLVSVLDIEIEKLTPYQQFILNNQAKTIRHFRRENNLSQNQLADLLSVNRQRVSCWESDKNRIPYEKWLIFDSLIQAKNVEI